MCKSDAKIFIYNETTKQLVLFLHKNYSLYGHIVISPYYDDISAGFCEEVSTCFICKIGEVTLSARR